jgi:hypothetical protein
MLKMQRKFEKQRKKKSEKDEICDMLFNVYSFIILCMQEFILIV